MKQKIGLMMIATVSVVAVFAAACGDDDRNGVSAADDTPRPSATAYPPEPTPELPDPRTQPSGVASVDRAIAALSGNDLQGVIDLIVLEPQPCVAAAEGLGGPPECGTGEAVGTDVDVVLFASCEGYWVREHQLEVSLARFVEGEIELYAVYDGSGPAFDGADYVAVFASEREEGTLAQVVYLSEEGITGVDYGCGQSPEQFVGNGVFAGVIVAPQ